MVTDLEAKDGFYSCNPSGSSTDANKGLPDVNRENLDIDGAVDQGYNFKELEK